MNEILNFFTKITGDAFLGVGIFLTVAYILYLVLGFSYRIISSGTLKVLLERRGLNADQAKNLSTKNLFTQELSIKQLLIDIGFLVANLIGLILVANVIKGINLSPSMTQKLTIGAIVFFIIPVMIKSIRKKDFA
jgi:hypothetical protein